MTCPDGSWLCPFCSEAQPALAPEAPVDPAAGRHRACDGLAEMAVELRGPGNEREAETIVDHGEAARGEIEALAKRSCDGLALGRLVTGEAGWRAEVLSDGVQFAVAKGRQQIAGKGDPLTLPSGEAFGDKVVRAAFQCLANLCAKSSTVQRCAVPGKMQAVEPGRTIGLDLGGKRQIGTTDKRQLWCPVRLSCPEPGFDNATLRRVAGRIEIPEAQVMNATINTVNDRVAGPGVVVIKPAFHEPPEDRRGGRAFDGEITRRAVALGTHGPVHPFDDVAAHPELAQSVFGIRFQLPDGGGDLFGESEPFQ